MASQPSKKRRLTPSESEGSSVDGANAVKVQKAFFKSAANWTLENDYESRRKKKKLKDPIKLPIKTADGRIEHIDDAYDASVASDAEWLQDADGHDVDQSQDVPKVVETPRLSEREQILVAKEELAKAASLLNEDPDENPGAFKALAKVGDSPLPSIQKLSLVTQLAVYKDVIPGYRIRSVFEDAPGDKLSKEVRRTRTYETVSASSPGKTEILPLPLRYTNICGRPW